MYVTAHSVQHPPAGVVLRRGITSSCEKVANFSVPFISGSQRRKQKFETQATAATEGTGVDFGSLFSEALRGNPAPKAPESQLPDASSSTTTAQDLAVPSVPDVPEGLNRPQLPSQPPPEASPGATERLSQAQDSIFRTPSSDSNTSILDAVTSTSDQPSADVSGAATSTSDMTASAIESVQSAAADLATAVQNTASEIADSSNTATSSAFAAVENATSSLQAAADDGLVAAQSTATDLLSSASSVKDDAIARLLELTSDFRQAAFQASVAAKDAADQAYGQLPEPLQQIFSQAASTFQQAASQAAAYAKANPSGAAAVAIPVLVGGPLALWLVSRLTAYGGNKTPEQVIRLLETSDAVLVDIRSEGDRRRQGLPLLEGDAFGKGSTIPRLGLGSAASKVENAAQLQIDVLALTIAQLSKIRNQRTTAVVVLDRGDGSAVPAAKRLQHFGILNSYVVRGGFRQWVQDGLPVQQSSDADYVVSPLQLLGTRTSLAAQRSFRNPTLVVSSILGVSLTLGVLVDWHRTLQYIGAAGLLLTVLNRTRSYQDPKDLLDDVSTVATTVIRPVSAVAGTTKVVTSAFAKAVGPARQAPERLQQSSRRDKHQRQTSGQPPQSSFKTSAGKVQDTASQAASSTSSLGPSSAARD